jgi:hypothetical protein
VTKLSIFKYKFNLEGCVQAVKFKDFCGFVKKNEEFIDFLISCPFELNNKGVKGVSKVSLE